MGMTRQEFGPLVAGHFDDFMLGRGFLRTLATNAVVRYESARVVVDVYWEESSQEVGVEVELQSENPRETAQPVAKTRLVIGRATRTYRFSLDDIGRLLDADAHPRRSFSRFVATPEQLDAVIRQLLVALKDLAPQFLDGDVELFEKMRGLRQREAAELTRSIELADLRKRADKLWHDKDYLGVVKLLERIGEDQTPAEKKKLEIAQRYLV
jgi:hypothetical protein